MNKELSDKLAGQVCKYCDFTDGSAAHAASAIAKAITQATSELQAENAELKEAIKGAQVLVKTSEERVAKATDENHKLYDNADHWFGKNMETQKEITKLQADLTEAHNSIATVIQEATRKVRAAEKKIEQLQGEVAGLREAIENLLGPVPAPDLFPQWFVEVLADRVKNAQSALTNTQSTAQAYRDKVREEVIRECGLAINKTYFPRFNPDTLPNCLEALLTKKEGGN